MKMTALLTIVYLLLSQASASASGFGGRVDFPADFKERAFQHIVRLVEFGPRSPGSEGEKRAFRYICEQLTLAGLDVRVEKFEYETFNIEHIDFTVCGERIEAETIGFDPYLGRRDFGGKVLLVGPDVPSDDLGRLNWQEAIVVTTSPVDYFSLLPYNPRLIVYVSNPDFARLEQKNCLSCNVAVEGRLDTHTSANIVAELPSRKPDDKEVIISAHWDSYRDSPGADDNASGVGVLLELARFFSAYKGEISGTVKFVSFGAEELGIVGSRAYLDAHRRELRDCILVFNMDNVGGPEGPVIEMLGGVRGIPDQKGTTQFPAHVHKRTFEGLDGRWRIIGPDLLEIFMVTNRPPWLVEAIESSAEQLGVEIHPAGNMGADQQVFTQAGIVATSVGTSGNRYHSPADVPAQIQKDKLKIVGKMVASVVLLSLRSGGRE
jgi:acetylornithine deacetylase/succinyl-diaminopimelate desuccinylase-like protein